MIIFDKIWCILIFFRRVPNNCFVYSRLSISVYLFYEKFSPWSLFHNSNMQIFFLFIIKSK